jgi:ABC-2 type transport system permease protein
MLNAALTIGLATAAAGITEHPSTAAIVTLTVTVGTWILNFIAAVEGGVWEHAAGYTPTAMVAEFQHGLIRLDVLLVATTLFVTGLAVGAIWTRLGVAVRRRVSESMALGAFAAAIVFAAAFAGASWDTSEARANSFTESDEVALKQIRSPLRIEAHLAAEDPRRVDLERKALSKLRRTLRRVDVTYVAATTTGLFEQTAAHYGEIWYDLDGRRAMSRVTTAEGVLETIFDLAGIKAPQEIDSEIFRGHPLAVPPKGAAAVFYGIWPALIVAGGFLVLRRQT